MVDESGESTKPNEKSLLPSNLEAMDILLTQPDKFKFDTKSKELIRENQLSITLSELEGTISWSIGYFIGKNDDGTYIIEHLLRAKEKFDLYWNPPSDESSTWDVDISNIFPVIPTGDWEVNKSGKIQFKLKNGTKIRKLFKKYLEGLS